jgi:AAA+ superfamily predicted ATPase
MYQELQPGIGSSYPTPALIREMFVLDSRESTIFHQRLQQGSALMRSGMITVDSANQFHPIKPTSRARFEFFGWGELSAPSIPGAVMIPAHATWDDLVIPEQVAQNLREFILWVVHRQQVEEWGGRVMGGPVALFSGPSGTGKTYAAEVVANALGRPLYRVDLGMLVSKYIGETEKNLNKLFDVAQNEAIVLLFDEADSLFGKRGEVKEARDRYANMEVSHLLSRIERHQGPCILTSNLREYIDQAFLRRFQIVVNFSRPDAAARTEIWRRHIPARAPLDPEIDFSILGKEFNLTGGQIRNSALHAAFLAAGSSSAIGPVHIASAVWTELSKKGGELSLSGLGNFGQYLPSEADS